MRFDRRVEDPRSLYVRLWGPVLLLAIVRIVIKPGRHSRGHQLLLEELADSPRRASSSAVCLLVLVLAWACDPTVGLVAASRPDNAGVMVGGWLRLPWNWFWRGKFWRAMFPVQSTFQWGWQSISRRSSLSLSAWRVDVSGVFTEMHLPTKDG